MSREECETDSEENCLNMLNRVRPFVRKYEQMSTLIEINSNNILDGARNGCGRLQTAERFQPFRLHGCTRC